MLPYINQSIDSYSQGKKLIVVHTLGSHQSYIDRIEKKYERFRPICQDVDVALCSKEELVNTYDNTIVAIDDFLASIISKLQGKKAMLIYLSNHGESLGGDGYYFHGKPRKVAPKEQFMIPFVVWFSSSYRQTEEGINFANRFNVIGRDNEITHDYLYHSILGCAGIASSDGGIDDKLDLCSMYKK